MPGPMINVASPQIGPEELEAVQRVLASGQIAQGPRVADFEEAFATYVGTGHAVAVASGTEAIRLALLAIGVGPGDEVVIPAFTFVATATAVMMCGAVPVIADVEIEHFCLDPGTLEAALSERTQAVLPVHLYGHPADLDALRDACDGRDVAIVEDACQAHGAMYRGRRAGSIGAMGCFSFYPTKNMTTGEGGMVTTDDGGLAERLRLLRQHGMDAQYSYRIFGYNSRMTDIEAAIGLVQLGKLEGFNAARRANAARLTEGLGNVVATPTEAPWASHVYHQYTIRAEDRDALREHLRERGVGSGVYYPHPLTDIPTLEGKTRVPARPEVTSRLSREVLSLPVHPGLSEEDVDTIVREVRAFYG